MIGITTLILVTVAAALTGYRMALGWSQSWRMTGVTVFLLLGVAFFQWVYDSVAVVALFPPSMLPFAAEWQVPLVALCAGIFLRETKLPFWRRVVLGLLLVSVSLLPVIRMVTGKAPRSRNVWNGEVCRQTNPSTCSAAAAATLLQQYGIATSEAEMIDLCFTRKDGTSVGGLVHGLNVKTKPGGRTAKVASLKLADLKEPSRLPAILIVSLRQEVADRELRYENQWGWAVGLSHAVVLFGFTGEGNPIIGDPSVGKEVWNIKGLEELWTGTAVWLEK
jgi:hypothetical protein